MRAADAERRHYAGKEHGIARRQDDQSAIGQLELGGRCLLGRGSLGGIVHGVCLLSQA
jgi:hypothetical protein